MTVALKVETLLTVPLPLRSEPVELSNGGIKLVLKKLRLPSPLSFQLPPELSNGGIKLVLKKARLSSPML